MAAKLCILGGVAFAVGCAFVHPIFSGLLAAVMTVGALKTSVFDATLRTDDPNYLDVRRQAEVSLVFVYVAEFLLVVVGLPLCERL